MGSIFESLRKKHAARVVGGVFAALAYLPAAASLPRASTLAGLAASILLGASLGAGLGGLARCAFSPPLVGAGRNRAAAVTPVVLPPPSVAPAALPIESTPAAPFAQVVPDLAAAESVTPPLPVVASGSTVTPTQKSVVLDGGASVRVRDGEYVTVTGEATSLRALVAEICRQAGVDLRTYSAPDRRYTDRLEDEPLADAFRRILRSESYLVGLRPDASSDQTRMAWLQVVASRAGGRAQPVVVHEEAAPEPAAVASPKRMPPP